MKHPEIPHFGQFGVGYPFENRDKKSQKATLLAPSPQGLSGGSGELQRCHESTLPLRQFDQYGAAGEPPHLRALAQGVALLDRFFSWHGILHQADHVHIHGKSGVWWSQVVSPTFFFKKGLLINLEKLRLDRDQLFVQRQNAFLEQEVDQHGSIIVAPADARPAPELNGEPEGIRNGY